MKGGENDFLSTMVASGVGAYAAKQSTSIGGLLWTLFKYGLVVVLILVGVSIVAWMFRASTETFVPVTPSPEQDRKVMTPAGNVITY